MKVFLEKMKESLNSFNLIWKKRKISILSIIGIVIVLTLFAGFSLGIVGDLTIGSTQTAVSSVSAPGGFPIPRPMTSSSSSVSSVISSSVSSVQSSSISSSIIISSSSAFSSSSSNPVISSQSSVQPVSSSSSFFSSAVSSFSSVSSVVSSSRSSLILPINSSSSNSVTISSQQSQSNQSSSLVASSLNISNSSQSLSSPVPILNFDPNNPLDFNDPSKGDPAKGDLVNPPTDFVQVTPRTGGPEFLLIPFFLILGTFSFIYYKKSKNKSTLKTKEKKLK
jgi:hypothetical protein